MDQLAVREKIRIIIENDVRLVHTQAATPFREGGLVHQQWWVATQGRAAGARCVPYPSRSLRGLALPSKSQPQCATQKMDVTLGGGRSGWGSCAPKPRSARSWLTGSGHACVLSFVRCKGLLVNPTGRQPGHPQASPDDVLSLLLIEFLQILLIEFASKKVCHDTCYKSRLFL